MKNAWNDGAKKKRKRRTKIKRELDVIQTKENIIMDAIKNLTDAVTALSAQVALIITALSANNSAVQAAADAINAETAKIKAALATPTT